MEVTVQLAFPGMSDQKESKDRRMTHPGGHGRSTGRWKEVQASVKCDNHLIGTGNDYM